MAIAKPKGKEIYCRTSLKTPMASIHRGCEPIVHHDIRHGGVIGWILYNFHIVQVATFGLPFRPIGIKLPEDPFLVVHMGSHSICGIDHIKGVGLHFLLQKLMPEFRCSRYCFWLLKVSFWLGLLGGSKVYLVF